MKQLVLSFLLFAFAASASSQIAEAVVFSEFGEKFTAYLNGEVQNDEPTNNVRLTNLTSEFYQLRVDFEDPTLADFSSNNFAVKPGMQCTYMIKLNRKGKYVCRYQSESPLSMTAAKEPEQKVIVPVTSEPPAPQTTQEQVVMTTQTETVVTPNSEQISMDVKVPGIDVSFKVNTNETVVTEEIHTITTSSSSASQTVAKEVVEDDGCPNKLNSLELEQLEQSIESKSFADTKMTIAKQALKDRCLKAAQVKSIMMHFDFEDDKLELAKFCYDYTIDTNNYYQVNDAFTFEMTIDELNAYIQSK